MRPARRSTLKLLSIAAATAAHPPLRAQDGAPVRLLVGFAAGGPIDLAARLLADRLRPILNRPVIVDNKAGAGQRIALQELRRATPDGSTLLIATSSPFTIFPHIYTKLDYDPVKDFTAVAGVASFDMGVATGPMTGAADLTQLIAWCRANGGKAVYGTPGAGTLPHFIGAAFTREIGVSMQPVHYKGGSPPMADLAGGNLPLMFNGLSDMLEMHRSGKVRVLAVTGERRSPLLPDVPTLKESGIGVSLGVSAAVFGPAGIPAAPLARMNGAIGEALQNPELRERFAKIGLTVQAFTPTELAASLAEESKRLAGIVRDSGYVPE